MLIYHMLCTLEQKFIIRLTKKNLSRYFELIKHIKILYKGNVKKNKIYFMHLADELNLLSYIAYINYKENIEQIKQPKNKTENKTKQSNDMKNETIENFDKALKSKEFIDLWDKLPFRVKYLVSLIN